MSIKTTITCNSTILNQHQTMDSTLPLRYNSVTDQLAIGTKTLYTKDKVCADNIILGDTVLNTNGKMIANNIQITVATPEYKFFQYIVSNGTEYIDTGLVPNNNYGMLVEVGGLGTQEDTNFIGCRIKDGERFSINITNSTWGCAFSSYNLTSFAYDSTQDKLHQIRFNYMNDRKMTIESQSGTYNITSTITQTLPTIILFGQSISGDIQEAHRYAYKLGRTIITNGRTIVMNLFPAQRISDSVIGMYDSVSNRLLTNNGSGQFYTGTELW